MHTPRTFLLPSLLLGLAAGQTPICPNVVSATTGSSVVEFANSQERQVVTVDFQAEIEGDDRVYLYFGGYIPTVELTDYVRSAGSDGSSTVRINVDARQAGCPATCCTDPTNSTCIECVMGWRVGIDTPEIVPTTSPSAVQADPTDPPVPDAPRYCCHAIVASCEACKAGMSVDEVCESRPELPGCPGGMDVFVPNHALRLRRLQACCRGYTATCMACVYGLTEDAYCAAEPATPGCDEVRGGTTTGSTTPSGPCCQDYTSTCMACLAETTEELVCAEQPFLSGCSSEVLAQVVVMGKSANTDCTQRIYSNTVTMKCENIVAEPIAATQGPTPSPDDGGTTTTAFSPLDGGEEGGNEEGVKDSNAQPSAGVEGWVIGVVCGVVGLVALAAAAVAYRRTKHKIPAVTSHTTDCKDPKSSAKASNPACLEEV